jgi:CYTH domain-containing protein
MPDDILAAEIERKFLVRELQEDLQSYTSVRIEQGYLAATDEGELRLRRYGGTHTVTLKSGRGLARGEDEVALDAEQFSVLWPLTEGKRVEKTRFSIPLKARTMELDVFHGELEGLILAEIEFTSVADAERFSPPAWLGKDVTQDERYKNKNLALHGRPSHQE